MKTLVIVAKEERELHPARKHLAYDRLVVVVPEGGTLRAALGAGADSVRVVEMPPHDLLACLERMENLVRGLTGHVRAVIDGGTLAMSMGSLLACFSTGTEAWFFQDKPVRLPILRAMDVRRRFRDDELAVIRALRGRMPVAGVARKSRLGDDRAKGALLALRKQGVVHSGADGVKLTELGRYLSRAAEAR